MKKTIWVIDDDPIYQIIMKKIIDKSDSFSKICKFKNGDEAITELKNTLKNNEKFPDLILLDIEMPIMDGWGFMAEFELIKNQIHQEISIYISSSSIAIDDKQRAKVNPHILGYMSKPISLNDLLLIASS